jgi:hypothetical protein
MNTLLEFVELGVDTSLESEIKIYEDYLQELAVGLKGLLTEGVTDFPEDLDIDSKFEEAIKRLLAAKKGLGLANSLKDVSEKREHQRKVMANLNRLRNLVISIEKEMESHNLQVMKGPNLMSRFRMAS